MGFPAGFVWGAATSAYQVEGAAHDDGKGPSVWDVFCRRPGAIWDGQTGDVACDHYHHYRAGVALLKEIGVGAYRFSISWPRVLPEGTGAANPAGLAFYDRLVDELLAVGIEPYVTLFHWDLPYALYCRGGWLNPDVVDWFAAYAEAVVRRLGDRVGNWMTINEPQVVAVLGHLDGIHAPGDRLQLWQVLQIAHRLLLAHGRAVQAIRAGATVPCQVGIVTTGTVGLPATDSPEDVEAARRTTVEIHEASLWAHTWWMDPIFHGHYPEDGLAAFGRDAPAVGQHDMAIINQPLDYFGINMYSGSLVQRGPNGQPQAAKLPPGWPRMANHWPVAPTVLYWGARFFYERYRLPIIIAENGLSNIDWVGLDGQVHDPQRIDYTQRCLLDLRQARDEGVDVRAYFHWSALDNFEWAEGTRYRFGLIYVDYATQSRLLKDSARWYRRIIETNGEGLLGDPGCPDRGP